MDAAHEKTSTMICRTVAIADVSKIGINLILIVEIICAIKSQADTRAALSPVNLLRSKVLSLLLGLPLESTRISAMPI